tara:strand:+ start:348 stop:614 length:267 start_codon:yes stop_codon:yes gene_type:complete
MRSIFEISYDEHGRLQLLVEDVQRWLKIESLDWAEHAQRLPEESFGFAQQYAHTSLILQGLEEQLDHVYTVDDIATSTIDESDDLDGG